MPTPPFNSPMIAESDFNAAPTSLMQRLKAEYIEEIKRQSLAAKVERDATLSAKLLLELITLKTFDGFIAFAEQWLASINPVVRTFYASHGIGLQLADNSRVVMSAAATEVTSSKTIENVTVQVTSG